MKFYVFLHPSTTTKKVIYPFKKTIFLNFRLELYMAVFKVIQKYKISYDGPVLGIDYLGNF